MGSVSYNPVNQSERYDQGLRVWWQEIKQMNFKHGIWMGTWSGTKLKQVQPFQTHGYFHLETLSEPI